MSRTGKNPKNPHSLVLTLTETAAELSCSIATINRMIASGSIPHVRVSEVRVGVLREDIIKYLQDRRVPAKSEPGITEQAPRIKRKLPIETIAKMAASQQARRARDLEAKSQPKNLQA